MAFNPGATNYQLDIRQRSLDKTTDAKRRQEESARERRIRQSGQRSGAQKLLSAAARGAAAYFTAGASETFGGGKMIDAAMLGTDSEGGAVRNEFGDLVGLASDVGSHMSAKKAGEAALKLTNQSKADQAMQTRLDNLDPTGRLGMEYALRLEDKNTRNTAALQKHKGGFHGLMNTDVEGLDLKPTTMGDWENVIAQTQAPEAEGIDYNKMLERKGAYRSAIPEQTITTQEQPREGIVALSEKDRLEQQRRMRAEQQAIS